MAPSTVVLVHGLGGGAWGWGPMGKELDARGVAHVAVDLPSVGVGVDPTADMHADAEFVRSLLNEIDGPIVLCGNSYGGAVITEASAGQPNVARLVYLTAFMPDADDDLTSFMPGNSTPEFLAGAVFRDDGLVDYDPALAKQTVFQECSAEVADWAATMLRPTAMGAVGSPRVLGVGWHDIPSTYIVCTEDHAIQPDAQRRWAAERATDSVELPADHAPMLSYPAETAAILARLASA
jgi:pimeloyl-ACP methyl ester carboxylesterase